MNKKVLRITPADIIDRVKETPKSKIDKIKKAEVIIDRVMLNKTIRELGADKQLADRTILNILHNNKELLQQIQMDKAQVINSKEEEIVASLFVLVKKKIDRLLVDENIDNSKLSELTTAIKDLRNEVRLNQGKPTTISARYKDSTTQELKTALIKRVHLLEDGKEVELLQATFNKD